MTNIIKRSISDEYRILDNNNKNLILLNAKRLIAHDGRCGGVGCCLCPFNLYGLSMNQHNYCYSRPDIVLISQKILDANQKKK